MRFRGTGRGKALGLAFLASHYVVERHREALLWSFFVARSDSDSSQTFSAAERRTLLSAIGYMPSTVEDPYYPKSTNGTVVVVREPIRQLSDDVDHALMMAGLNPTMATHYSFISQERGYPYVWLEGRPQLTSAGTYVNAKPKSRKAPPNAGWPIYQQTQAQEDPDRVACTIDVLECFGDEFLSPAEGMVWVEDAFKRIAFEKPQCGDCIISSLLGASGTSGFSAFLPGPSAKLPAKEPVALSMVADWKDATFDALGGRTRAVQLLQRYSYVLGKFLSHSVLVT